VRLLRRQEAGGRRQKEGNRQQAISNKGRKQKDVTQVSSLEIIYHAWVSHPCFEKTAKIL